MNNIIYLVGLVVVVLAVLAFFDERFIHRIALAVCPPTGHRPHPNRHLPVGGLRLRWMQRSASLCHMGGRSSGSS
jgi:hypothetical protein